MALRNRRVAEVLPGGMQAQGDAVLAAALAIARNPVLWDAVLLLVALSDVETDTERWEAVEAVHWSAELAEGARKLSAEVGTLDAVARGWAVLNTR